MPELQDSPNLRERIIAESKQYVPAEPSEDEFTRDQFMDWCNIENKDTAYRKLDRMIRDGKITKRKGKVNGSGCNLYKETT